MAAGCQQGEGLLVKCPGLLLRREMPAAMEHMLCRRSGLPCAWCRCVAWWTPVAGGALVALPSWIIAEYAHCPYSSTCALPLQQHPRGSTPAAAPPRQHPYSSTCSIPGGLMAFAAVLLAFGSSLAILAIFLWWWGCGAARCSTQKPAAWRPHNTMASSSSGLPAPGRAGGSAGGHTGPSAKVSVTVGCCPAQGWRSSQRTRVPHHPPPLFL